MSFLKCLVISLPVLVLLANAITTSGQPKPPASVSVAVEGVVLCKSCKLPGYNKSMDASPIHGALASIQCVVDRNSPMSFKTTADNSGYFLIQTPKLPSLAASKCKVFVLSSPLSYCDVVVPPGRGGASLKFERVIQTPNGPQPLYSAGPFLFAPKNVSLCP